MAEKRAARKQGSGWLVAVPRMVRDRLKLTEPGPVYWHLGRRGEAVLTRKEVRTAGGPDTTGILKELAEARKLIEYLRRRDESRDRAMYAEGYALGRQDENEVLMKPTGKRANELRRRRQRHHVWAGRVPRGYVPADEQERSPGARPVEVVEAPVLVSSDGAPVEVEARDPLSGEVVRAVLSEGPHSP